MNIAIVYDSSTGTTAQAAEAMGTMMAAQGHQCSVQSWEQADPAAVSNADLICIGSWVKGLFVIMQHPTEAAMRFMERLGDLTGKQAVVFCTYKLASGSTLKQMARTLERKGAQVVGLFKYRSSEPNGDFASFAKSLA